MNPTSEISIIIPAYNEEQGIADVITRIKTVLGANATYEILVIDDGSEDGTAHQAKASGALVISNPQNMGYGFSLKRGFKAARYECAVIIDADGTYPVESLPLLVAEYERGIDMVVGARQGRFYWSSASKRLARLCFKWMSEFVVGRKIPDINSGLRVIRRSKILPLLPDLSNRFSFTTSATLIFFLQHYFISYIPVEYASRRGSSKVHYFRDALITLQIMVDIIAKYNPIKLFLLLALAPFFISVLLAVLSISITSVSIAIAALISFGIGWVVLALGFVATIFRKSI